MFSLTQTSARQREILEVVLSNGWEYMRGLLTAGKTENPQIPTPEVLRNILIELGPFYVKLGQLLSTRPDILSPNYIQALTALQSNVSSVPWKEIEIVLNRQLSKPIKAIFSNVEKKPIAAGSIGQIHRGILLNGEEVAIKIQRPNIDKIVQQDITLIKGIAELVSLTEFGKNFDIPKLADEFCEAIESELDFTKEASYTDTIRNNLSSSIWFDANEILTPKVYWEITTEKILVLEWLHGKPILEADLSIPKSLKSTEERRKEITTLLFRAFFQQIYVDGFFHADPHPGNLFYLNNGRVAIIDCGMVGKIDSHTQKILIELLLAIFDLDAQGCAQLTFKLSESDKVDNLSRLKSDYEKILKKYHNLNLSQFNFSEVVYEILQIARKNKLKIPGNLGLYAKCLGNLEGTARQFNPSINLFDEINPLMTNLFYRQLVGDTPLQTGLRTILDLKSIYLKTPRRIETLLDRLSSETFNWNIRLRELEPLRRSIDASANRLSFSIVLGSLIMGAAIISVGSSTQQLSIISSVLFASASILGVWLIISILRSGRLK
ncbi:MAG: AarF/ABC1/UbiB kinase family protein [Candidatus Atelocyanobacterium thalassa]